MTIFAKKAHQDWDGKRDAEGKCQGEGTIWYSSGVVYIGNMVDDMRNGYGTYYHIEGQVYEGQWLNDVKQG